MAKVDKLISGVKELGALIAEQTRNAEEAVAKLQTTEAENERLSALAENYGAEIAHLENGVAMYEAGILTQDRLEAEAERDAYKARVDALEAGLARIADESVFKAVKDFARALLTPQGEQS